MHADQEMNKNKPPLQSRDDNDVVEKAKENTSQTKDFPVDLKVIIYVYICRIYSETIYIIGRMIRGNMKRNGKIVWS